MLFHTWSKPFRYCAMVATLTTPAVLSGCQASGCDSFGAFALDVSVTDARTQQSALPGATVVIVHEGARDSTVIPMSYTGTRVQLHDQETGNFTVTIRKAGYQNVSSNNVLVSSGDCGRPNTVRVDLTLSPVP
jgi:hypothetical protein